MQCLLIKLIVKHHLALGTTTHRGEPHIILGQTAGIDHLEALLQLAEVGVGIVCTKSELYATLLGHTDNLGAGQAQARIDFELDDVLNQHIQHLVQKLLTLECSI